MDNHELMDQLGSLYSEIKLNRPPSITARDLDNMKGLQDMGYKGELEGLAREIATNNPSLLHLLLALTKKGEPYGNPKSPSADHPRHFN